MRKRKKETPLPENYHFPPELLNEVILRLPPKTLVRFRCVCKSWCSLIDSPDFIHMHLNVYPNNRAKTQLLVEEKVPKTLFNSILTVRRSDNFRKVTQLSEIPRFSMVYKSCMVHGLMLMDNADHDEFLLWNPSIRNAVLLPPCPFKYEFWQFKCLLGFAPLSCDYKVFCCKLVDTIAFAVGIAVYSLRDHYWRVIQTRLKVPRWCFEKIQCRIGVVFARGVVYWKPGIHRRYDETNQLLCFDFDVEEFCYLELPEMEDDAFRFIFALGGSLSLLVVSSVTSCIWKLEKNDGTKIWCPYWKGDTNLDVYGFFDESSSNFEILYIEDSGKFLIQCFRKLMAYDIRSNQTQYLGKSIRLSYVETYVESLVLHKNGAASTSLG